MVVLQREPR